MEKLSRESPIEEKMADALRQLGVEFTRQEPIGPYFADIYVPDKHAVIECDGVEYHKDWGRDVRRDEYMRGQGYIVMRYSGKEITDNPIRCACDAVQRLTSEYRPPIELRRMPLPDKECSDPNCYECWKIRRWNQNKSIDYDEYLNETENYDPSHD